MRALRTAEPKKPPVRLLKPEEGNRLKVCPCVEWGRGWIIFAGVKSSAVLQAVAFIFKL